MKTYHVYTRCHSGDWFDRSVDADGPSQAANKAAVSAISAGRRVARCDVVCPDGEMHSYDVTSVRVECLLKLVRP